MHFKEYELTSMGSFLKDVTSEELSILPEKNFAGRFVVEIVAISHDGLSSIALVERVSFVFESVSDRPVLVIGEVCDFVLEDVESCVIEVRNVSLTDNHEGLSLEIHTKSVGVSSIQYNGEALSHYTSTEASLEETVYVAPSSLLQSGGGNLEVLFAGDFSGEVQLEFIATSSESSQVRPHLQFVSLRSILVQVAVVGVADKSRLSLVSRDVVIVEDTLLSIDWNSVQSGDIDGSETLGLSLYIEGSSVDSLVGLFEDDVELNYNIYPMNGENQ